MWLELSVTERNKAIIYQTDERKEEMRELIIKCYEESDDIVPIHQFPEDGMNIPIAGELIRCKDCKSYQPRYSEGNVMLGSCQNLNSNCVTGMGYCYWAERKEQ